MSNIFNLIIKINRFLNFRDIQTLACVSREWNKQIGPISKRRDELDCCYLIEDVNQGRLSVEQAEVLRTTYQIDKYSNLFPYNTTMCSKRLCYALSTGLITFDQIKVMPNDYY